MPPQPAKRDFTLRNSPPRSAVLAEQIRLLYGRAAVIAMHLVAAALAALLLRDVYPGWAVLGWFGLVAGATAGRLLLWDCFRRRHRPAAEDALRWGRYFTFGTIAVGCLWGSLGFTVFLTDSNDYHLFVAFLLGGMCAAASMRDSFYLPAFVGFVIPAIAPWVTGYLAKSSFMSATMGLLLVVYASVLLLMGRDNNRRIVENIRMRLQQAALNTELQRITGVLTSEIADRERITAALEDSSERFRAMGDNAQDPIIIADADDRVVYWNPAAERIFGYMADEILGRGLHSLLVPERYREHAIASYRRFARTGEGDVLGRTRPFNALRKDGTEVPVELSISAIRLRGSWHALGIARDVSERKVIETALRERGDELKEAQRLANLGSWTYQPDTGFIEWSPELYRMFGRDLGLPSPSLQEHAHFLSADSFTRLNAALAECCAKGASYEIDLEGKRPDGTTVWIAARGEAQFIGGRTVRVRSTAQDITARKIEEAKRLEAEATFRALVEQGMSGIVIIDEDGTLAYLNPRFAEMAGFRNAADAVGRPVLDFIAESDRTVVQEAMRSVFSGKEISREIAAKILRSQGGTVDTLSQWSIATFKGKRVVIIVLLDITERKRSEEEIAHLNEQMTATVAVLRRRERDQTALARLSDMLQSCHSKAEAYPIIANSAGSLFRGASGGALAQVVNDAHELDTVAEWGGSKVNLVRFHLDDCWALRTGQRYEVDGSNGGTSCHHFRSAPLGPYVCLPLTVHGETTGLLHVELPEGSEIDEELRQLMLSFGDVVKLSLSNLKLRETLSEQAMHDALTGLFNRHYLAATLPREISRAQRKDIPLTLAMMDIDHFRSFNEGQGHDAGDMVLKEIGSLLRHTMRSGDIACRYGGEELLLALPDCDIDDARNRLEQICSDIKQKTFTLRGEPLPQVTLSVGVAQMGGDLITPGALITAADEALYAAKRGGRDRIELYAGGGASASPKRKPELRPSV